MTYALGKILLLLKMHGFSWIWILFFGIIGIAIISWITVAINDDEEDKESES